MWVILFCMLCTLHIANRPCHGINFIDLPGFGSDEENEGATISQKGKKDLQESSSGESTIQAEDMLISRESDGRERVNDNDLEIRVPMDDILEYPSGQSPNPIYRRHWLVSAPVSGATSGPTVYHSNDKDEKLKSKINTLVQQTVHDTELKMKILSKLKERHRDKAAYKVGFILSMIKKSRDVLNELFNVAIKHRDEWKSLEQLKIFELIVHTNVDTTNYVRQLVEIHIKHLNATAHPTRFARKRAERIGGDVINK